MTRPLSEFDPDWKYGHQTRDGRPARIICKDRKGFLYNLVVLVEDLERNEEIIIVYKQNGMINSSLQYSTDLFNKPAPKVKRWIVYDSERMSELYYSSMFFDTEFDAKTYKAHMNSVYHTDSYKIKEVEFDVE